LLQPQKRNIFTVFPIKSINLKLQPENQVQLQLAYHKILQRFSQKISPLISKYCQLEYTITLPLKAYPPDRRLCCITVLKEYLKRTESLRKNHCSLFISYVKPYNPVSKSTISRWLKTFMCKSGIDINKYYVHSIRAASASKAKLLCIPIDNILKSAGWSSARTFAKFYDKQVEAGLDFQTAVLS
jgi:hypothetical protein